MHATSSTTNGPLVSENHSGRRSSHLTQLLETAEVEELRSLNPGDLETLRKRAADADRLEIENVQLREQLAQKDNERERDGPGQLLTPAPINVPRLSSRTPASDADEVDWKRQAAINGAKYSRISTELQKAKEALVRLKEDRDAWKECAEKREKKIKARQAKIWKLSEAPDSTSFETENRPTGQSLVIPPPKTDTATDETSTPAPGEDETDAISSLPTYPTCNDQGISSSLLVNLPGNARQDDIADIELPPLPPLPNGSVVVEPIKIKQEPSSDSPVVVLERSVWKRKLDEIDTRGAESGRVKREQTCSSDPVITATVCDFSPAGTVDLDEPSARLVDTPRKRRAYAMESLVECRPLSNSNILQDRHPNIQSWKARDTPLKRGLSRALAFVAEDGVVYKTTPTSRKQSGSVGGNTPQTGKLKELLDERQTGVESPIIRSASRQSTRRDKVQEENCHIPPRDFPFNKTTRKNAKPSSDRKERNGETDSRQTTSTSTGKPGHAQATGTPTSRLRFKPQSVLRIGDFKINPNSNDGYRYAYSEVVRNRDERSRLPGCVDPDCCGPGFRELALAERGTGPRTPEQQVEDRELLESYLGGESYRLFTMTKEEKDELWVQAKAQEISNRSGKHRHRFTRMKSPPGFWRTDFPSTQEIAEEKAEALRREREAIQERYREAMRPDGRWKFRDE
jgi:hypothetical protein